MVVKRIRKKSSGLRHDVDYYMNLPYTMTVKYRPEQGGYYVAGYVELPDLTMTGDTPEEAVRELLAEKADWFKTCLDEGFAIPLPVEPRKYSGKIMVRIPPSLHESLIEIAAAEGVSLNQVMVAALSRSAGRREVEKNQSGQQPAIS